MKKIFLALLFINSLYCYSQKFHDARIFNAPNGNVKSIEYEDGILLFSEDGRLIKDGSTYISFYSKYKITHNAQGFPVSLETDFENISFEYDTLGRIIKRTVKGSKNNITLYDYKEDGSVEITDVDLSNGQPKKTGNIYDMNEYDWNGNWIQKGKKGKIEKTQDVYQERIGLIVSGHYETYVINGEKVVGREAENRKIRYYNLPTFKILDSPNEVSIYEAIEDPLFLGAGTDKKKFSEKLKENDIDITKGYYGHRSATLKKSNKTFYGFPISNMLTSYFKDKDFKDLSQYRFLVEIPQPDIRDEFFEFLRNIYTDSNYKYNVTPDRVTFQSLTGSNKTVIYFFKTEEGVVFETKYNNKLE